MIDHFNLPVTDLGRSTIFYRDLLAPLGYGILHQDGDVTGFGSDTWGFGLIQSNTAPAPAHIAFRASDDAAVDAFHATGLRHGARCNGAPGLRAEYGPHYYAGFLIDPDGNNIEAVSRGT